MRFHLKQARLLVSCILGLVLILSGLITLVPQTVRAADFNYRTQVDYIVQDSGVTHVAQHYTVTNNTARTILQEVQLSTPTNEVSNLKVTYADGTVIPFSQTAKHGNIDGYTYDYVEVDINFNRDNAGNGVSWAFAVDYDTNKLVETKGSAHTVFIPAIGKSNVTQDYSARLLVPDDFGKVHATAVKPVYEGLQDGRAVYEINKSDLTKKSITLVFGDSTIYHVNFNFPLKNTSSRDTTFTVTLPPDTPSQKIYINSLDPKPQNLRLDNDGNVLADYRVAAGKNIAVRTNIDGVVKYLDYDLSKSGTKKDIPASLVKNYTDATKYWQSNDTDIITKAAQAAAGAGNNVADITKALNTYVIQTLTYNNEKIKYNIRQGALNALNNPSNAVCLEYSDLLIALLRAQGIPARMPIGYGYSGNLKTSNSVVDSLHSWVEVYMPGVGWVNVDPTWDQKFNTYGKSDLDHFAFAIWGRNDNSPDAVMINGNDQNYQYENTQLDYKKVTPPSITYGRLALKQYVILPLVSIARYELTAPPNVSGDNYQLELRNNHSVYIQDLGSLAAGQQEKGYAPFLGLGFSVSLTGRFIQQQEGVPVLAVDRAEVNWYGFWLIVVLLSGIILTIMLKLLIKRRRLAHARVHQRKISGRDVVPEHDLIKAQLARRFRAQARARARAASTHKKRLR